MEFTCEALKSGLLSFNFSFLLITDSVSLLSISWLSHPHNKTKLNGLEIKYFPQIHQRTEITGQTAAPRIGETGRYRESWLREQELRGRNLREPKLLGFYQRLTNLGGGKYPAAVPSSLPVSSKGRKTNTTEQYLRRPHPQGYGLTNRLRPNHRL